MGSLSNLFLSFICIFGAVVNCNGERIGDSNSGRDWFLCPFDADACFDYSCKIPQAHIRAGFTCESFPYYSGGVWQNDWKTETKIRNCTIDNYNNTIDTSNNNNNNNNINNDFNSSSLSSSPVSYCQVWQAIDYKEDTTEFGYCQCEKPSNSNKTCEIWICYQEEFKKNEPLPDYEAIDLEPCPGDNKNKKNFTLYCPIDELDKVLEMVQCWCFVFGGDNEYCLQFYCEERDYLTQIGPAYKLSNNLCESFFPLENTKYDGNYDYFNHFCWKWRVNKESNEQFEISECICDTPSNSIDYCVNWHCEEKEMLYYDDSSLFLFGIWFFNILVFMWNLLPLLLKKLNEDCINLESRRVSLGWFIIGLFIINIGTILCSGLIGEIFYIVIWYFSWHTVFVFYPYKTCNSYKIIFCNLQICDNLCCLWDKIDSIIHVNMIDGVFGSNQAKGGIVATEAAAGGNNNNNNNNNDIQMVPVHSKPVKKEFVRSRKEFNYNYCVRSNLFNESQVSHHKLLSVASGNEYVPQKDKDDLNRRTLIKDLYFLFQQCNEDEFFVELKYKIPKRAAIFPFDGQLNTIFDIGTLQTYLKQNQTHYESNTILWDCNQVLLFLQAQFNADIITPRIRQDLIPDNPFYPIAQFINKKYNNNEYYVKPKNNNNNNNKRVHHLAGESGHDLDIRYGNDDNDNNNNTNSRQTDDDNDNKSNDNYGTELVIKNDNNNNNNNEGPGDVNFPVERLEAISSFYHKKDTELKQLITKEISQYIDPTFKQNCEILFNELSNKSNKLSVDQLQKYMMNKYCDEERLARDRARFTLHVISGDWTQGPIEMNIFYWSNVATLLTEEDVIDEIFKVLDYDQDLNISIKDLYKVFSRAIEISETDCRRIFNEAEKSGKKKKQQENIHEINKLTRNKLGKIFQKRSAYARNIAYKGKIEKKQRKDYGRNMQSGDDEDNVEV